MVKFLDVKRTPSTSERFANAFGGLAQAAATGIPQVYGERQKLKEAAELKKSKDYSKIRSSLSPFLKNFDTSGIISLSGRTQEFEDLAKKFYDQGYGVEDSMSEAYKFFLSPQYDKYREEIGLPPIKKEEKGDSLLSKFIGTPAEIGNKLKSEITGYPESVGRQLAQMGRKGVGALQGFRELHTPKNTSPVQGFLPHGRETLPNESNVPNLLEKYDELVGEKGIPRNALEDVGSSVIFGPSGMAGRATGLGLEKAGLPAWASELGEIGVALLSPAVLSKIGSASKIQKVEKALEKAAKISRETGIPADEILLKTGADLNKVAAGDEAAISQLSERVTSPPKVAEKVKSTPKEVYNKKQAIKEREIFGEKLPETPVEEYYDIRDRDLMKETKKLPETKARDAEVRESLKPQEAKLFEDLRSQQDQLNRIKREKISNPSQKQQIEAHQMAQEAKIAETKEALRDTQFQMKYGRPRQTEAQIDAQVQKSVNDLIEEIRNPTEKSAKAVQKAIEDQRKLIEVTDKILKRGEIPGEVRPDTFIKMKQKYIEGYQEAIAKQREILDEIALKSKKTKLDAAKSSEANQVIDHLNKRISGLEREIVKQTDNIRVMNALEKPSGAFYKNQLKTARQDLERFNYDLFKQKRVRNPEEFKTTVTARKHLNTERAEELGRKSIEDPKLTAKELAKDIEVPEKVIEQVLKEAEQVSKVAAEKAIQGTLNPNDEVKFLKKIKNLIKKHPVISSIASPIVGGAALGAIQASIEEVTGWKPNVALLRSISKIRGGTGWGYNLVSDFFSELQAHKFLDLAKSDPKASSDYLMKIRKKHGSKRINKIKKVIKEEAVSQFD